MKKIIAIALLCAAGLVRAEKADSAKPLEVTFDQNQTDELRQISIFTGNVVMTRGTMLIKAGRVVATRDPAGNQFVTLYAEPGKLVTYRQKRDGGDLWVEAQAERVEYDDKTEILQFFSKGRLRQLDGARVTNEVEGEFISYNSRNENFGVNVKPDGEAVKSSGRGRVVFDRAAKGAK